MKISVAALRTLIRESIDKDRIIRERPWSVEYTFSMSGGAASDSEGEAPDGFAIVMKGDSDKEVRIVIDSYWNPQTGNTSGNELRVEGLEQVVSTYVPIRFDSGEEQVIVISNSPVSGMITVAHGLNDKSSLPVVHLVFPSPFAGDEDVNFSSENLGAGDVDVKLTRHTNI